MIEQKIQIRPKHVVSQIDDYAKDGGPGAVWTLCSFYHNPMRAWIKGELQRENKLLSYERAFKMLENDMYIARIGQAFV